MAEFLGNIKGPQGERGLQGVKGDEGDIKKIDVGTLNNIDLFSVETYQNAGSLEVDIEKGIVSYKGMSFYVRTKQHISSGVYYFKIKDYQRQTGYGGMLNLRFVDMGNNVLFSSNIEKNTLVKIDLSSVDSQQMWIEYRTTGVEKVDGFIEKPMLVMGDYPVLWHPSLKDMSVLNNKINPLYNYRPYTATLLPNVETSLGMFNEGDVPLPTLNGERYLDKGQYLITANLFAELDSGELVFKTKLNNVIVHHSVTQNRHVNVSFMCDIKQNNTTINFTLENVGSSDIRMRSDIRNSIQIKKI